VGSSSKIGSSLADLLTINQVPIWLTTRKADQCNSQKFFLDLAQPASTWQLPDQPIRTAVICAAITSQKFCEQNYNSTYVVNVTSTIELARLLVNRGVLVVFVSTNLVFDGTVAQIAPDSPKRPKTAYGRQKDQTEEALLSFNSPLVSIVRLSKVVDNYFALFHSWIADLKQGKKIHPFDDLYFAPIALDIVTDLLFKIALQRINGVIQFSATDDISYANAACYLSEKLCLNTALIEPVSCHTAGITDQPKFTTMNTDRLAPLGINPPSPWSTLDSILTHLP
jgi:dTDP-4-dehydrorhamnose reductase